MSIERITSLSVIRRINYHVKTKVVIAIYLRLIYVQSILFCVHLCVCKLGVTK